MKLVKPAAFPVVSVSPFGRFVLHGLANHWMEPVWPDGRKVHQLTNFKAIKSASGNAWLTNYPFYSWREL